MSDDVCSWEKLLCSTRLSEIDRGVSSSDGSSNKDTRSNFARDFARVLYSTAFRRLQDKTQVFPIGRNDYVRTRLTHSLEVVNVGRYLGESLARMLTKKCKNQVNGIQSLELKIGEIVATACLAHDIGNPPFGHSGESAINSACGKTDFVELEFEGNAQGFRILSDLCDPINDRGLDLTVATLAAFTKYPRTQLSVPENDSYKGWKKFGIYNEELATFTNVATECGLIAVGSTTEPNMWRRHPLSYLMEAADDISYIIADVEDAYKSNIITYDEASEQLNSLCTSDTESGKTKIINQTDNIIIRNNAIISYLRSKAVGSCINSVETVMNDNLDNLRDGKLDNSLVKMSSLYCEYKKVFKFSKEKIYNNKQVLAIEISGHEIIMKLVDLFMNWVKEPTKGLGSKLIKILDPMGVYNNKDIKERFMHMRDYISGMTDSYAKETYKRLYGLN